MPTRRSLLAASLLATTQAAAQDWPGGRPIRIVVPFPPGGSTDLLARRIAERIGPALGTTVLVENRPGAGGTTGSEAVARAAPDGLTLLMGVTGTHGVAPSLFPNLGYDPRRDFVAVTLVVTAPLVLAVHPAVSARTVAEFVALARADLGGITYGTPGNGTSMHLTGVMFDLAAGTRLTHVPYRGSAPALNDLVGGQLRAMFGDFLVLLPQLRAGTIRAIAVTARSPHALLPDVPTIAASDVAGLAGFEVLSWQGVFAPAGTPPATVARLAREIGAALATPDIRNAFAAQGFSVAGGSPEALTALVAAEVPKWATVVRAGGVRPD